MPTTNFTVDPDQTVPRRAVRFGSTQFAVYTDVLQTNIVNLLLGEFFDMGPHCLLQRQLMVRYVREMQLMLTSMANFSIQTNIMDLDQTALRRAVYSGFTLFATKGLE